MQTTAASLILRRCLNPARPAHEVPRASPAPRFFFAHTLRAMNRRFPVRRSLAPVLALCAFAVCDARAYTVNIGPATRAIYLQVGNGSFTGTYSGPGTPRNNPTVNPVPVTAPAPPIGRR